MCSGYTNSHLNEPTRAASLTQTPPGGWVSFPNQQVVSSSPTCTCQGEHAKTEREEKGASPPQGNTAPAVQILHRGAMSFAVFYSRLIEVSCSPDGVHAKSGYLFSIAPPHSCSHIGRSSVNVGLYSRTRGDEIGQQFVGDGSAKARHWVPTWGCVVARHPSPTVVPARDVTKVLRRFG